MRPRDHRNEQEYFRNGVNRRPAEYAFPTNELDNPLEYSCGSEKCTDLESLDLDAFRGKIEILGNDKIHYFSSVQVGIT